MTSTSWNFQQGGGVNVKCPLCGGGGGGGVGGGYGYFLEPHNFHFESPMSSKTSYYSLLEVLRKRGKEKSLFYLE